MRCMAVSSTSSRPAVMPWISGSYDNARDDPDALSGAVIGIEDTENDPGAGIEIVVCRQARLDGDR